MQQKVQLSFDPQLNACQLESLEKRLLCSVVKAAYLPTLVSGGTQSELAPLGDYVYYIAKSSGSRRALYRTRGTDGESMAIRQISSTTTSNPGAKELQAFNGRLYCTSDSGALYSSDGTSDGWKSEAGESQVTGLAMGNGKMYYNGIGAYGASYLFAVVPSTNGSTVTTQLANCVTLEGVVAGTKYYFLGNSSAGIELWVTDGTIENTHMVADINPGRPSSAANYDPFDLWAPLCLAVGDDIYFQANDGVHGTQLYRTKLGGLQVERLTDFATIDNSVAVGGNMVRFKSRVYFTALASPSAVAMTYSVGDAGDVRLEPMSGAVTPAYMLPLNDYLVYIDRAGGLYATNGDGYTTVYLGPASFSSTVFPYKIPYTYSLGTTGFLRCSGNSSGSELWQTDGTPAGTRMVADINPTGSSTPDMMTMINGDLYFYAAPDSSHRDIWRYDFTAPSITATSFELPASGPTITATFDDNVSSGISSANLSVVDIATQLAVTGTFQNFDVATRKASFSVGSPMLPDGNYRATISNVSDVGNNNMSVSSIMDFFFLNGDANRDRLVDTQDFNLLAGNFGLSAKVFSDGDFTFDGVVDSTDFDLLVDRIGKRLPEPVISTRPAAAMFAIPQSRISAKDDIFDASGQLPN